MIRSKFFLMIISFGLAYSSFASDEFSIAMKKAGVKKRASFLSPTIHFFKYGDPVSVIERKGDWVQLKLGKKVGWCHKTCIADRDSILKDIGKGEKIAKLEHKDEVTLAGKGFSEQHEDFYKKKNPKANFKDVNKLESFTVDSSKLASFVKRGELNEM